MYPWWRFLLRNALSSVLAPNSATAWPDQPAADMYHSQ